MVSRRRRSQRFAFASHAVHHHRLRRRPAVEVLEGRALLATFTVNSVGDGGLGSSDAGDLRYCINQANVDDEANTIVFDPTVFGTPQTITLNGGQLELKDTGGTQTITGPAAGVTISGGGNSRVFDVDSGVTASLSGLTISGGTVSPGDNGGGLANYGTATLTGCTLSGNSASASYSYPKSSGGFGGGVFNSGTANLTLTDCTISGNSSGGGLAGGYRGGLGGRYGGDGGGLANYGTATLTGCTFSGNSALASYLYYHSFGGLGGGVFNSGTANLILTDCTVSGNSSGGGARDGGGGGLANYGAATLTGSALSDNYAPSYNGDYNGLSGFGAGVLNSGTANLTLTGCTVSGNSAVGGGGGVSNSRYANLTLTDCAFSGNSAYDGAGVWNGSTANLTDCAISGNSADTRGGGLFNGGMATLTGCTLSGNNAGYGGGLANYFETANLTDCTVSGNSSGEGGGVFSYSSTVNLTDCTVSGNAADLGGGLANYNIENIPAGPATLTNTIVAGNTSSSGAGDIGGTNVSGSDNLIGTGGSGGLTNGIDGNIVLTSLTGLGLAPLGNNGGPTQTMALLPGSPAIGAGVIADYPDTTNPITTDQRGEPLDSPNPDIGAFQTHGSTLTSLNFSGISNQSVTYGTASVTISGTLANGSQAPVGETVVVTLDGVRQSATIGSGGAFFATFNDDGLAVAGSPYTVSYDYTSDVTFASASTTSTLTVNPATLTITADPATKTYGTTDPALSYTARGFQFSDSAATVLIGSLSRAEAGTLAGEQAGGYAITQGTLAADSNYTITFTGSTLTISPATLTVIANPQTKAYGTADPTLTDTTAGLVNTTVDGVAIDDTAASALTGHLSRTAGKTVAGGPYAITQGTLAADSNYTIQFTGSALTITQATPLVSVSAPGGTYTGAPIAATVTVTGVGGTATSDLEGETPTLTYYPGSGTSGTNLGSAAPYAAGTYTVVARFAGSADYAAAESKPATFAIAPARATIAVSSSSASPVYGQAVTFVATVTFAGVPGGTVTFADGTTPLATVPLDDSGQAALTISTLSLGSHAITVTYNGDADSLGVKSDTAAESVSPAATAIVLAPHAVLKGKKALQGVELTAAIEPVAPAGGVPTGHVIFEIVKRHGKKTQVTKLGTAAVSGGAATLTLKRNVVLNETLTIVYSGDPDFLASMMSPLKLTRSGIASAGI